MTRIFSKWHNQAAKVITWVHQYILIDANCSELPRYNENHCVKLEKTSEFGVYYFTVNVFSWKYLSAKIR